MSPLVFKRAAATFALSLLVFSAALFAGCTNATSSSSSESAANAESSQSADAAASSASGSSASAQAASDSSNLSGANWRVAKNSDGTLDVVDMWGNTATLPHTAQKIYSTSPIGTYMSYCIDYNLLIGWNSQMSDAALAYLNPAVHSLEPLGGNMGGNNTIDTEYVVGLNPDIIVAYGKVGGSVSEAVKTLGEQTNIPVIFFDSDLGATADALRFMGAMTGQEARAEELASYCETKLEDVRAQVEKIPADARRSVYYAESADGLSTDGNTSMHTEVLNWINANNVVTMDTSGSGMGTEVSLESVLQWNPDVILCNAIVGGADFMDMVYDNADWAGITAVQNHDIYMVPSLPFNWFDRPPCLARVLGCEWVAYKLYPDYIDYDMVQETIDFYKLFYQVDLSEEEAKELIGD